MPTVKLQVVGINNVEQSFGTTDYAMLDCITENQESILVGVSHNLLKSKSVEKALLDSFIGSTVIVKDSTDINTGVITSAEDRVNGVLNGTIISERTGKPVTLILLNRTNGDLTKSVGYLEETKDLISSTNAKISREKEKEKIIERAKKTAEDIKAKLQMALNAKNATPVAEPAVLETNDEESPF